jgi:hypothetical protein
VTARGTRGRTIHGRTVLPAGMTLALLVLPAVCAMAGLQIRNYTESSDPWNAGTFAQAQLIGTGDNFAFPTTVANFVTMEVNSGAAVNWRVSVARSVGSWNADLVLSAVLSDPGNPAVTVETSPLPLTTTPQGFFIGTGPLAGTSPVVVSYSLVATVIVGPGTYSTTVSYTIAVR